MPILERKMRLVRCGYEEADTLDASNELLEAMRSQGYYPEMIAADGGYIFIMFVKAPVDGDN